jgi:hypothetical protein
LNNPGDAYWMFALSGNSEPVTVTGDPGATNSMSSKERLLSNQSRKFAGATGLFDDPWAVFDSHKTTRRSVSLYKEGANITP